MIFSVGIVYSITWLLGWYPSFVALVGLICANKLVVLGYQKVSGKKLHSKCKKVVAVLLLIGVCVCLFGIGQNYVLHYLKQGINYYRNWHGIGALSVTYGWMIYDLLLVLSVLCYQMMQKKWYVKIVVMLGSVFLLVSIVILKMGLGILPVACILWEVLLSVWEGYQKLCLKREQISIKEVLPFLLLIMLFTMGVPKSSKPISWKYAIQFWENAKAGIEQMTCEFTYFGDGGNGDVTTIGYNADQKSFWGKLFKASNDQKILSVQSDSNYGSEEQYFVGSIKEIYNENNWSVLEESQYNYEGERRANSSVSFQSSEAEEFAEYQWELEERLYHIYQAQIPVSEKELFCRANTYTVSFEKIKTSSVFYPRNCYTVSIENPAQTYDFKGQNIRFTDMQKKGMRYKTCGIQMNLNNPDFVSYLQEASKEERKEVQNEEEKDNEDKNREQQTIGELNQEEQNQEEQNQQKIADTSEAEQQKSTQSNEAERKKKTATIFDECVNALQLKEQEVLQLTDEGWKEKLELREAWIQKQDVQLPKNMPTRVYALADRLTVGLNNDYDKVQAIVSYLKESGDYVYTLSPETPKENVDMVDYFLFEGKEGYCSYFASATALLCRCAGIPSRYVEGVIASEKPDQEKVRPVYAKTAHAWTQVYIHGYGWLDVDATPGFDITTKRMRKYTDITSSAGGLPKQSQGGQGGETKIKQDKTVKSATPKKSGKEWLRRFHPIILLFLIASVLISLLVVVIFYGLQKLAYRRAGNRKKAEICIRKLEAGLREEGLELKPNETLRQYAKRLSESGEAMMAYAKVFRWYEGVRYGQEMVEEEQVRELEQLCRQQQKSQKAKRVRKKNRITAVFHKRFRKK